MKCPKCFGYMVKTGRFASSGSWYKKYRCVTIGCRHTATRFDRKVDQNNDKDCEAADSTQGIV